MLYLSALIELCEVSRVYNPGSGEVRALDGVSLRVEAGEFISVVGPSGSGKSTMMNLIGCLDMPTCGRYLLEGSEITALTDDALSEIRGRKIGFIFQGFNLIPGMTAMENVELPLLYRGIGREKRRKMALEALWQVDLPGRTHHRPNQMSGGQQQRVAIARAIASKPPIILADEPTGNLDSASGGEIMRILHELSGMGKTVILITHDDGVAANTDRTVRIQDGRVVADSRGGGGRKRGR
ncbi:MAG: ABC transporter ATP-binding protein, partial [Oscillospiraceae bacterium]|nr:ABC transporter ATP-binding protein [Oscillospiraceae bacterium]